MKIRISLYQRFMLWISILLILLVGAILFVVQSKEVSTLFAETQNRALLTARYIANLNQRPLIVWDLEAIQSNVDQQIDAQLVYVIIYDRAGNLLAANEKVRGQEEIICCSRFPGEASPDASYVGTRDVRIEGRRMSVLEVEIPVFASGSPTKWGSVKIGHSLEDLHTEARRVRMVLLAIGLAGFLLGIIGSTVLAKRITRPIKNLVDGTIRVAKGDFTHHIEADARDEIGELARSFNKMTGRLLQARERMEEANRKLVQAEKLASIGRLSATIAHEIRNPLTSVKLNIQKVAENEKLDEVEQEHLGISQEGIGQIEKFIKDLLNFTRAPELHPEHFSVEQIMEESIKLLKGPFAEKGILLERQYSPGLLPALVDGDKMRQVFLNLLRNACEAVGQGGRIQVSLESGDEDGRPAIRVGISDDGPGIPEKDWDNIFEPFFTTKPSGFGLGLANARRIVEQHNGSIQVVKKGEAGTTFFILIPCEEGP